MLSAILYLGNVTYTQSEDGQGLEAGPADVLSTLSDLLKVEESINQSIYLLCNHSINQYL